MLQTGEFMRLWSGNLTINWSGNRMNMEILFIRLKLFRDGMDNPLRKGCTWFFSCLEDRTRERWLFTSQLDSFPQDWMGFPGGFPQQNVSLGQKLLENLPISPWIHRGPAFMKSPPSFGSDLVSGMQIHRRITHVSNSCLFGHPEMILVCLEKNHMDHILCFQTYRIGSVYHYSHTESRIFDDVPARNDSWFHMMSSGRIITNVGNIIIHERRTPLNYNDMSQLFYTYPIFQGYKIPSKYMHDIGQEWLLSGNYQTIHPLD